MKNQNIAKDFHLSGSVAQSGRALELNGETEDLDIRSQPSADRGIVTGNLSLMSEFVNSNPVTPTIFPKIKLDVSSIPKDNRVELPQFLTPSLAEDVGIQMGDGCLCLGRKKNGSISNIVQCVGNITEDYYYVHNHVAKLKKKLYNIFPLLNNNINANTYVLKIHSKTLLNFYHKVFNLPIGKKINLSVPKILYSNDEFLKAFIRGISDTDATLGFREKYKDIHYYPILKIQVII